MKTFAALLAVLALAGFAANAENFSSTGYSAGTTIVGSGVDACANGTLFVNHDGGFENGYCWQSGGIVPPYYGAFAEGFDLGSGCVFCGAFWLTQVGQFTGRPADLYVWDGDNPPGAVVGMVAGHVFQNIAIWPSISQHDADMGICVYGPFSIGYWADFSAEVCQWFIAADQDGFGGMPWTCIAPGIGYPTGWNNPTAVWGPTQSMGLGAWFGAGYSPVEAQTWGSIKALFE